MERPSAKIYQADDGSWRWRVRAANGEIVASSEGYTRRSDARRALKDALDAFNAAMAQESNGEPPQAA